FGQLGEIIKAVKSSRLKACLDTAHAFESGYNLGEVGGLDKALEEFDHEIGLERLVVVHTNDSKTPLSSGVDRHENIGQGYIGESGFRIIVNHPSLKRLPFIIETP
ncbi:MAG: TIM barrel protein, partial [Nitrososphaeria archaeon]|nr:TIM barrel protein [Nitrososphaeria archaeon]